MLLVITLYLHFFVQTIWDSADQLSGVSRSGQYTALFERLEELCRHLIKAIVWPLKKNSNQRPDGWFVSAKLSFLPPVTLCPPMCTFDSTILKSFGAARDIRLQRDMQIAQKIVPSEWREHLPHQQTTSAPCRKGAITTFALHRSLCSFTDIFSRQHFEINNSFRPKPSTGKVGRAQPRAADWRASRPTLANSHPNSSNSDIKVRGLLFWRTVAVSQTGKGPVAVITAPLLGATSPPRQQRVVIDA